MSNNNQQTTTLPALPKLPKKAKAPKRCGCGCTGLTKGGYFLPGHDATLLAWTQRVEAGISTIEDCGAHGEAVKREMEARAKAGLTGATHAKVASVGKHAPKVAAQPASKKSA